MMKPKQLIFFLVIFFLLTNCQKKIDLNLPAQEQKIVINGVLAADSTVKINITKSINTTDNNSKVPIVTNAQINLLKNGVFIEKLIYDQKKFYISKTKISDNQQYTLKISADNKNFDIEVKVPQKTHFAKIKNLNYDKQDNNYVLNLQIADKSEDNYYIISTFTLLPQARYKQTSLNDSISLTKNYINLTSKMSRDPYLDHLVNFYPYFSYAIMFNDALFAGDIFDKNFLIKNNFYIDTSAVHIDSITVYFQLFSISKDLYNFFISYQKYAQSFNKPFSEPVNIYSNIKGGAGILCGLSSTIDSVKLPYIENNNWKN